MMREVLAGQENIGMDLGIGNAGGVVVEGYWCGSSVVGRSDFTAVVNEFVCVLGQVLGLDITKCGAVVFESINMRRVWMDII